MYKQLLVFAVTLLALCSCGVDGKHFKLEGRILNINRGEFYIYDEEGIINGVDTIKVEGGRFTYEVACERPTTLMLVFPNFSEQPIFAETGQTVSIKGDASHLKELKVKGTDDNELMSDFREQIAGASPPEARKYAAQFIEDHPESPVGLYLVKKFFLLAGVPDTQEALRLTALMASKQPDNNRVRRLTNLIKSLGNATIGTKLPTFTAHDMDGHIVSSADLSVGLTVIATWASWNYDSMDQLRQLRKARRQAEGRLKVVTISVDASRRECRQTLERDSITWQNICDGMMFEGKAINTLGLTSVPDNILVKNGRIIARNIPSTDLEDNIRKNL